jgi:hypothetical protein
MPAKEYFTLFLPKNVLLMSEVKLKYKNEEKKEEKKSKFLNVMQVKQKLVKALVRKSALSLVQLQV